MTRSWRWASTMLSCVGVSACAATIRPPVLVEAAGFRSGAQGAEAEKYAPQAYAHATNVERQAEERLDADDALGAELLGERALGAYNRAFLLARLAKAADRELRAYAALDAAKKALATTEEQHVALLEESKALEMRLNVIRDAVPVVPNPPADKAREEARRTAVRALALQARMLCIGAEMLSPKHESLARLFAGIEELENASLSGPAPIDEAIRLRSGCLEALSSIRAPGRTSSPAHSEADALLSQLSAAGYEPHRDDRGIVVTLRDVLERGALSPSAASRVQQLAQVSKTHPQLPLLVAAHAVGRRATKEASAAADAVMAALESHGVKEARSVIAGAGLPLAVQAAHDAKDLNTRVEIVFVDRSW